MKKLHILGMAKSSLDLRGAKAPKLELDYLRLVFAVAQIKARGEDAVGYLVVLNQKVADTARKNWVPKYGYNSSVEIVYVKPRKTGLNKLLEEKRNQAASLLLKNRITDAEKALSVAKLGKQYGERELEAHIARSHPRVTVGTKLQFNINWDYYGTVTSSN